MSDTMREGWIARREEEAKAESQAPRPRVEGEAELQAALDAIKAAKPCPNVTTTLTALRELAKQDSHYRGAVYDTTTLAATVIEHLTESLKQMTSERDYHEADAALIRQEDDAELARLTAEVERLRGEKAEAVAVAREAIELVVKSDGPTFVRFARHGRTVILHEELTARLAALALPTTAPEATDG